jgi:hypothetical protein
VFYTVGVPAAPVITEVTNSNIPTVYFSMVNAAAYELEILKDGEPVYQTGVLPFRDVLFYRLTEFIPHGTYVARIRVQNQYGLQSGWGRLAFTISAEQPNTPILKIDRNTRYFIRLYIEWDAPKAYVYRSEFDRDDYKRIAKVTGPEFDDYTAAPGVRYKYFVRAADDNDAYSDSNTEAHVIDFPDTVIAEAGNPADMLKLLYGLGRKPQKNMAFGAETATVKLEGRPYPVAVKGQTRTRTVSYSLYCTLHELYRLEELAAAGNVLVLREPRYGTRYGVITGNISVTPEAKSDKGEFTAGFTFTVTDYQEEAEL